MACHWPYFSHIIYACVKKSDRCELYGKDTYNDIPIGGRQYCYHSTVCHYAVTVIAFGFVIGIGASFKN